LHPSLPPLSRPQKSPEHLPLLPGAPLTDSPLLCRKGLHVLPLRPRAGNGQAPGQAPSRERGQLRILQEAHHALGQHTQDLGHVGLLQLLQRVAEGAVCELAGDQEARLRASARVATVLRGVRREAWVLGEGHSFERAFGGGSEGGVREVREVEGDGLNGSSKEHVPDVPQCGTGWDGSTSRKWERETCFDRCRATRREGYVEAYGKMPTLLGYRPHH